jgi:hypothetical protein
MAIDISASHLFFLGVSILSFSVSVSDGGPRGALNILPPTPTQYFTAAALQPCCVLVRRLQTPEL